ncbi:MAG: putative Ribonuclease [Candidatus Saccharibacteria bacterium]|nr:putative Ribonuclease [Candidatus Saccharibacteria bacterium]
MAYPARTVKFVTLNYMEIVGIDEVGRGCLAGPLLVVAARAISELPSGLDDSKVLSRQVREELFILLAEACEFGEGWVKSSEIDGLGLTAATKLGVRRALRNLRVAKDEPIVMDGNYNYAPGIYKNVSVIIAADALVPIVSAASIYAKVRRDEYMRSLAHRYPKYGFETNVGYGTAFHLAAIDSLGIIKNLHRRSFGPLQLLQENLER